MRSVSHVGAQLGIEPLVKMNKLIGVVFDLLRVIGGDDQLIEIVFTNSREHLDPHRPGLVDAILRSEHWLEVRVAERLRHADAVLRDLGDRSCALDGDSLFRRWGRIGDHSASEAGHILAL